jgi:uncharacterized protein YjiS (DUF1127 family)
MEMVNCNDTIQLPDIRVNDRSVMTGNQVSKPATWRAVVLGLVISAIEYLAHLQSRARERHDLQMLDDRALKDIGITRADVDHELSKPIWTGFPPRG